MTPPSRRTGAHLGWRSQACARDSARSGRAPSRKTILLVDDQSANIEALELILGDEGYEVASAANGAEALERIREVQPDLVIIDMMMPVMDGAEMALRMRAAPDLCAIKIIVNSSLSEPLVLEHIERVGSLGKFRNSGSYDGFLRKPYGIDAALALIRRLLGT